MTFPLTMPDTLVQGGGGGGGITLIGTTGDDGGSALTPTFAQPGTVQADDFGLVIMMTDQSGTFTMDNSGWTQEMRVEHSGGRDQTMQVYSKKYTGAEPTVTFTNPGARYQGCLSVWRGVHTTDPFGHGNVWEIDDGVKDPAGIFRIQGNTVNPDAGRLVLDIEYADAAVIHQIHLTESDTVGTPVPPSGWTLGAYNFAGETHREYCVATKIGGFSVGDFDSGLWSNSDDGSVKADPRTILVALRPA